MNSDLNDKHATYITLKRLSAIYINKCCNGCFRLLIMLCVIVISLLMVAGFLLVVATPTALLIGCANLLTYFGIYITNLVKSYDCDGNFVFRLDIREYEPCSYIGLAMALWFIFAIFIVMACIFIVVICIKLFGICKKEFKENLDQVREEISNQNNNNNNNN